MASARLRVVAAAAAAALVVGGCGGGGGWPDDVREEYLTECRAQLGGGPFCDCALDALEEAFDVSEFDTADEERIERLLTERCAEELADFEVPAEG